MAARGNASEARAVPADMRLSGSVDLTCVDLTWPHSIQISLEQSSPPFAPHPFFVFVVFNVSQFDMLNVYFLEQSLILRLYV